MTKRIYRSICLVALVVFLSSVALIMGVLYDYFTTERQAQLKMQTRLAAHGIDREGAGYLEDLQSDGCRITLIGADGAVLFDNEYDAQKMENHLEREEVREALSSGYGESKRYSSTLTERSLYSAQRLADGSVVRLSVSQASVLKILLDMLPPMLVIFAVAVALSVFLSSRISKKIVEPLNEIDLDNPLSNDGYDELSPLLRRIDSQQKRLKQQELKLTQTQNELNTVIRSMNEGMILLNQKGGIISINPAAAKLLSADENCIGSDLLTVSRNLDVQRLVAKALGGERAEQTVEMSSGFYQIDASPIFSEKTVLGAALFFFDVTEKEKAEQMRREFTANVSHELKTPLHAILGYSELLKNGMVDKKDVVPFSEKIHDEAGRMVLLVEDIISLSHLDEGAKDERREDVDLYILAETAVSSLQPEAAAAGVTLTLTGEPSVLNGVPELLYSIVYNLCDNAVKYNRADGRVDVSVENETDAVRLTVSDTGIGIAGEHLDRIFERFYRVDKSRSKEVGGTGLGLSIVKHAAKIHNAKIEVDSAVERGTTVVVSFPKQ